MKKKIFLAGASGLVGGFVWESLVEQNLDLVEVGRRQVNAKAPHSETFQFVQTDFNEFPKLNGDFANSIGICCLGSTIKKAGSEEAFRKIDCDYVVNFAKWIRSMGGTRFLVVSALGANSNSAIFYNRVKGQMEEALKSLEFESLLILQPSLLLGVRSESRFAERIAIEISPVFSWVLVGPARKYRPIDAKDVAKCLIQRSVGDWKGQIVLESDQISNEVSNV